MSAEIDFKTPKGLTVALVDGEVSVVIDGDPGFVGSKSLTRTRAEMKLEKRYSLALRSLRLNYEMVGAAIQNIDEKTITDAEIASSMKSLDDLSDMADQAEELLESELERIWGSEVVEVLNNAADGARATEQMTWLVTFRQNIEEAKALAASVPLGSSPSPTKSDTEATENTSPGEDECLPTESTPTAT